MQLRGVGVAVLVAGCSGAVDLDDPSAASGAGGTGNGSPSGVTGSTGATGAAASTASTGTSTGATGSGASGGSGTCAPGTVEPCYDGPSATQGVGPCQGGTRTCFADGSGFGACQGQTLPAVEDCTTPLDDDCDPTTCPVALEWAIGLSGPNVFANDVAVDSAGNIVVVGSMSPDSNVDLGGGPLGGQGERGFVVELDPDGNHLWSHSIASDAWRVAVDAADHVVVTGLRAEGELTLDGATIGGAGLGYLLELDPQGALVWARGTWDNFWFVNTMALLPGGDAVLAGAFQGTVTLDAFTATATDNTDMVLARFDGDTGALVWGAALLNPGAQHFDGLAAGATGDILFTGRTWGTPLDLGGGAIPTGDEALFVARYDGNGQHLWGTTVAGTAPDRLNVAADAADNVLWTGATAQLTDFGGGLLGGTDDGFVAKLSPGGAHLWSRDFGASVGDSRVARIAAAASGEMAIAGGFNEVVDFGAGPLDSGSPQSFAGFVAKLDSSGNAIWSTELAGQAVEIHSVALAPTGHVVAVGYYVGEVDFWGNAAFGSPAGGMFIAKMGP